MNGATLGLHDLGVTYASRGRTVDALDGVTLDLAADEVTTFLGPSGCGKSTLLDVVAGLQAPSRGSVTVDGRPVAGPGRDRGVVFQSYTLFPWLSARRNVELALRDTGLGRRERADRAREQLALVGVLEFEDAMPAQLSGGMRQRVAIARALSYQPRVLLMDEPFGALDAQTREDMQALLLRVLAEHPLTVVFVTHDIEEAVVLSHRVVLLTPRPGQVRLDLRPGAPWPRPVGEPLSPPLVEAATVLRSALRQDHEPGEG